MKKGPVGGVTWKGGLLRMCLHVPVGHHRLQKVISAEGGEEKLWNDPLPQNFPEIPSVALSKV